MYKITEHTLDRAKKLGVVVVPSHKEGKKIDVLTKDGRYIASVGDISYSDYGSYIESDGIDYANQRRHLYKLRHERDRKKVGSRGWWADNLLW